MVCKNGCLPERFAQEEARKRIKIFLAIAILLPLLIPNHINAWTLFGPKTSDDCVLKYQKEAKCARAATLINYACKCRFPTPPLDVVDPFDSDCQYNPAVYDCILENMGSAQNDQAAIAISRSCISKYNK
jgi:hypothetical protein